MEFRPDTDTSSNKLSQTSAYQDEPAGFDDAQLSQSQPMESLDLLSTVLAEFDLETGTLKHCDRRPNNQEHSIKFTQQEEEQDLISRISPSTTNLSENQGKCVHKKHKVHEHRKPNLSDNFCDEIFNEIQVSVATDNIKMIMAQQIS